MKKRAQVPDAHTFTILFRGLGAHAHYSQALTKAISLYHSMFADNSPVKPNIIHTNSVLKVCTRAKDMDSLWGIAAKLPARGPGAPNNLTFTTILNAVRQSVADHLENSVSEEGLSRRRQKAILEGRRMWDDIIGRWRAGDIWIDEELVCAMGRLLLVGGRPRDWDDVLSLIEQTMAVPRLLPRFGDPAREHAPTPQLAAPDDAIFEREDREDGEPEPGREFDPVDISKTVFKAAKESQAAAYAKPGRNTLSLVMDACLKMRAKQTAQEYWDLLTDPKGYDVRPDANNHHVYMRLLRQSRASKESLTLLREEIASQTNVLSLRKTFRIAMSTCVRDKNNPQVMTHASRILDLMQTKLADPDIKTMQMYLKLAISINDGQVIAQAVKRLETSTINLKSLLTYGSADDATAVQKKEAVEAIDLLKLKISCFDRLLDRGEVKREEYKDYAAERGKLAAFVTRAKVRELKRKKVWLDGEGKGSGEREGT